MSLSNEQTHAMQTFVKNCRRTVGVTWLGVLMTGLALCMLERILGIGLCRLGLMLIAVSWVYPAFALLVIRLQTGLAWHLLHAHPLWHASLSLALPAVLRWLLRLIEVPPPPVGLILGIGVALLASTLKKLSQQRAQAEREQYGERWLKLGQLSFWDILFLHIPRQRV